MADKSAVQKYTGDTITKEQAEELMMNPTNLGVLTNLQRGSFLQHYSDAIGVDWRTKPFDLIPGRDGKLIIYANRACSDQLRQKHKLNVEVVYSGCLTIGDVKRDDVYMIRVRISNPEGRCEEHFGCVSINGLVGDELANAIMKCSTKAARRGTIAFCGLGMLDESEVGFASASAPDPAPTVVNGNGPSDQPAPKPVLQPKLLVAKPFPAAQPPAKV